MSEDNNKPRVVLGTMTFGKQVDQATADRMLGMFLDAGFNEIDTAYMYVDGKTEEVLGEILTPGRRENVVTATKANPWEDGGLSPASVRGQLETSLRRMKADAVDILYLHSPDLDTPLIQTLETCAMLKEEGKFSELGLSNYAAWQVTDVWHICDKHGWPKPVVYQGMYNAITREVERELFPSIRSIANRFYAYNPLAGGMLTGKHRAATDLPDGGRFHDNEMYQQRYWKEKYFEALEGIRTACEGYGITMAEASQRWLVHHSLMAGMAADAVIVGASSVEHLEANLAACTAGSLPEKVVDALNRAWDVARPECPKYFRP